MVFTLRHLQDISIEQNKLLYILFIDPKKAFDTVSMTGCPPKLPQMIHAFHDGMTTRDIFDLDISEPFNLRCGSNKDV